MAESTAVKRAEEPVKMIKHGSLLDQMEEMFDVLSHRAYSIFEENGRIFGRDLEHWFQAERELLHPVHVNIAESEDSLHILAEVPGFTEKELEISVEPRRLTITGKRETSKEEKKGKTVYAERCADQILRVVDLPVEVETGKVAAMLKNGVLELTMPKAAKTRAIRIHPKAA
ncbi:MAG: Hsp20/alpha crystallin family protein [Acidobacteriia bacterium]|nr:Hsp20/alpha crystallin family protein [Terriglobia bacterium]